MRAATLSTVAFVALNQNFIPGEKSIVFKASVNEDQSRLVIFEDAHGVTDLLLEQGLVTPPESCVTVDDGYAFWAAELAKVEVEWDFAELATGSTIRLSFPTGNGQSVVIYDWTKPSRFQLSIERTWVL
jgi:hypothetical protein